MSEQADSDILDYQSMRKRIPPKTPEERRWKKRRLLYYAALYLSCGLIACVYGPHVILFGKLTSLKPADFVPLVQRECVPVVRAIKEYQRDHGTLPGDLRDLSPPYLKECPRGPQYITGNRYMVRTSYYNHEISYDFGPGTEGWKVWGTFANGPIPLPAVSIAPSTMPTAIAK